MNNVKISLANVQGKLSRMEMKQVLGGLVPEDESECSNKGKCSYKDSPNSNHYSQGDCEDTPHPMQTGCACKRGDGLYESGCKPVVD